ncbi:hypothetical protein PY093_02775 [Cytobacillus sp. S13-E01]|uniref:hypothetical protein n=1 Tax=Cytobacillus sp. S13-E01 TaxID=3031326 RepID=UPI0023D7CB07|nr:hypothetical protein [Cytobacillus sp. S13-E01]MDF0725637.1 hypothetical protein [Cytobacillus sp. S13-E01]
MFTEMLREISVLPENKKYTKVEIMTSQFLLERAKNIEIFYAFHNEYINSGG